MGGLPCGWDEGVSTDPDEVVADISKAEFTVSKIASMERRVELIDLVPRWYDATSESGHVSHHDVTGQADWIEVVN